MGTLRAAIFLVAFAGLFPLPESAQAAVTLTLQPQGGVDLSNLTVGQSFTVNVELSGLPSGDELGFLAATVTFDGTKLGNASNVIPGSSVPDSSGFLGVAAAGLADGSYDYLFSAGFSPISANGVFYSFELTVLASGSGAIAFDVSSLAARNLADEPLDLLGGQPLAFEAPSTSEPVPEPTSLFLFAASMLGLAGSIRRTSLKRCREVLPI